MTKTAYEVFTVTKKGDSESRFYETYKEAFNQYNFARWLAKKTKSVKYCGIYKWVNGWPIAKASNEYGKIL